VKDAVKDLLKALELRPSRSEARAALADSYNDLGMEAQARAEWQQAISAQPENATWRFRYGKLLLNDRQNAAAEEQLGEAISLAVKQDPAPKWLADAHYRIARAMGTRKEAAKHWEAFLRLEKKDSPYRPEAKKALEQLGRPWTGEN
jgi:tetratricopeptide (TPR) repeat protein